MKLKFFICTVLLIAVATCIPTHAEDKIWNIKIENPTTKAQIDEPIVLNLRQLIGDDSRFCAKSAIIMDGDIEIPSQLDDMDNDMHADEIAFVVNLPAKSQKKISVML